MFKTLGFQGGRLRQCLLKVTLRILLCGQLLCRQMSSESSVMALFSAVHFSPSWFTFLPPPFFPLLLCTSSLSGRCMLSIYWFFLRLGGTFIQCIPNLAHRNQTGSSLELQALVPTSDFLNRNLSTCRSKGFMFWWLAKFVKWLTLCIIPLFDKCGSSSS